MFGVSQSELIEQLHRLQRTLCYHDPYPDRPNEGPPPFCDCKYGADDLDGECTGCPEVRMAMWIIDAMTPEEFEEITERANIKIDETDGRRRSRDPE